MQTSDPVKRQEMRQMSKKNAEFAGGHYQTLIKDLIAFDEEDRFLMARKVELLVKNAVYDTTEELSGDKQLEKVMKKSVQQQPKNTDAS